MLQLIGEVEPLFQDESACAAFQVGPLPPPQPVPRQDRRVVWLTPTPLQVEKLGHEGDATGAQLLRSLGGGKARKRACAPRPRCRAAHSPRRHAAGGGTRTLAR